MSDAEKKMPQWEQRIRHASGIFPTGERPRHMKAYYGETEQLGEDLDMAIEELERLRADQTELRKHNEKLQRCLAEHGIACD